MKRTYLHFWEKLFCSILLLEIVSSLPKYVRKTFLLEVAKRRNKRYLISDNLKIILLGYILLRRVDIKPQVNCTFHFLT